MKANNSLAKTAGNKPATFSQVINSPSVSNMIYKSIGDPKVSARFVSTLISVVSKNERLKECDPNSVISSALMGVGMNLNIAMDEFSLVPYGDIAQFQPTYKGISQLAIRSGQYRKLKVLDVREGEFKGYNMEREPIITWNTDADRASLPLAGFYGFYELKDGFFDSLYMTHEEILLHANTYSNAFNLDKYRKIMDGTMDASDVRKLQMGSPWYAYPTSTPHMKMCYKTVLRQLLGTGLAPKSVDMMTALEQDSAVERGGAISADDPLIVMHNRNRKEAVVEEIPFEATPVVEEVVVEEKAADVVVEDTPKAEASKQTRKPRAKKEEEPMDVFDNAFAEQETIFG